MDNGLPAAHDIAGYVGKLKEWDDARVENEVKQYTGEVRHMLKNLKQV
jgi:hypothetical protein